MVPTKFSKKNLIVENKNHVLAKTVLLHIQIPNVIVIAICLEGAIIKE